MDELLNELNEVLEKYGASTPELAALIIRFRTDINPLFAAVENITGPENEMHA